MRELTLIEPGTVEWPFALGHEFVAEVVEVGDAVERWSAGDGADRRVT